MSVERGDVSAAGPLLGSGSRSRCMSRSRRVWSRSAIAFTDILVSLLRCALSALPPPTACVGVSARCTCPHAVATCVACQWCTAARRWRRCSRLPIVCLITVGMANRAWWLRSRWRLKVCGKTTHGRLVHQLATVHKILIRAGFETRIHRETWSSVEPAWSLCPGSRVTDSWNPNSASH